MKRYLTIEINAGQSECNPSKDEICPYLLLEKGLNACALFLPVVAIGGTSAAHLPCTPLEVHEGKIQRCRACLEAEENWSTQ